MRCLEAVDKLSILYALYEKKGSSPDWMPELLEDSNLAKGTSAKQKAQEENLACLTILLVGGPSKVAEERNSEDNSEFSAFDRETVEFCPKSADFA
jgi:hypothetical protein